MKYELRDWINGNVSGLISDRIGSLEAQLSEWNIEYETPFNSEDTITEHFDEMEEALADIGLELEAE